MQNRFNSPVHLDGFQWEVELAIKHDRQYYVWITIANTETVAQLKTYVITAIRPLILGTWKVLRKKREREHECKSKCWNHYGLFTNPKPIYKSEIFVEVCRNNSWKLKLSFKILRGKKSNEEERFKGGTSSSIEAGPCSTQVSPKPQKMGPIIWAAFWKFKPFDQSIAPRICRLHGIAPI